jgi:hypothetical protein
MHPHLYLRIKLNPEKRKMKQLRRQKRFLEGKPQISLSRCPTEPSRQM